jgi:replication factor C subunit 3/5
MDILKKYLWVERYRPTQIHQMILSDDDRKIFETWIENKEIPNTLFVGKPGSGKTTLARILVDCIIDNKQSDVMVLNGSTQRGIDVVRDQIEDFLKAIILGNSKIKIVFIDEFDFMTQDAQSALRHIIEKYSDFGRFLLTANYESKIAEAIRSRMQVFRFMELPKENVLTYCENILNAENIKYQKQNIEKVVNVYYPDIRKIIGILQARSDSGELSFKLSEVETQEYKCKEFLLNLIKSIKNKDAKMAYSSLCDTERLLNERDVDYVSLYNSILEDKSIPFWAKRVVIEYLDRHVNTVNPPYNYIAMMQQIFEVGKKYFEAINKK